MDDINRFSNPVQEIPELEDRMSSSSSSSDDIQRHEEVKDVKEEDKDDGSDTSIERSVAGSPKADKSFNSV